MRALSSRLNASIELAVLMRTLSSRLRIVELYVPIEVIAPAFGRVAKADGNTDRRRGLGTPRHPLETQTGLGRGAAALAPVARDAAGDDVFPILTAALGDRQDMIERQLAGWIGIAAVLARVVVACVNIRPRERHVIEPALDLDVAKQPDDGRQLEAE